MPRKTSRSAAPSSKALVPAGQTKPYPIANTTIEASQIFHVPQRHPSGEGPWQNEGDKIAWTDSATGLAARRILAKSSNELLNAARSVQRLDNPGEELLAEFRQKWMRHVVIQEQISGMTAEAGRALQQFRQMANRRKVRTDILYGLIRGEGGKDGLKDAANRLPKAVEMGPGKFNAIVRRPRSRPSATR